MHRGRNPNTISESFKGGMAVSLIPTMKTATYTERGSKGSGSGRTGKEKSRSRIRLTEQTNPTFGGEPLREGKLRYGIGERERADKR